MNALHRLGHASARHPWRVVAAWVLAVVVATGLSAICGGSYRDDITAPGSSSAQALETLRSSLPETTHATAHVVATWPGTVDAQAVAAVTSSLESLPRVSSASSEVGDSGSTALLSVTYDRPVPDLDAPREVNLLSDASAALSSAGATTVAAGGELPESIQGPNGRAELVGVAVAVLVLLLAFASMWAAALPLLVAAAGLGVGLGLVGILSHFVTLTSVSPTLGSMIGLGVGIDYAFFVVAAHRRSLTRGARPRDAAMTATATAGRSVVLAGVIVLVGMSGLALTGVPGFAWMGVATGLVVLATVAAAVTLLPAVLGLLGDRVLSRRDREARHKGDPVTEAFTSTRVEAFTRRITRHPVAWTLASVVVLLALAAPALNMRLGQNDAGSEAASAPTRVAYDEVSSAFGPGRNGPLVVVSTSPEGRDDLRRRLVAAAGVATVSPAQVSSDGSVEVVGVVPTTGPQDEQTARLVDRLRTSVLTPDERVTGPTAAMLDLSDTLSANLWRVVAAVLAVTFVLLLVVFRSVVLAGKAVLVNLLSIGGAYGLMTLAFQTEIGARLIGLSQPVPIVAWAPVVLFAILFGLSMDYEMFLLTSIDERHRAGEPVTDAVVHGLGSTARVIVSAAAIMVAVAAGFALDPGVMIKIIGVGLVAAIVLDVTVVRLVLVPAAMSAMGEANWWLPRWLDRLLPLRSVPEPAQSATTLGEPVPVDA